MDSLKAGIIINNLLTQSSELKKAKVFPVVSEANTEYPFIVYRRTSFNKQFIKFGQGSEDINIEILVISDEYKESVELAQKVRNTLDNVETEGFEINMIDAHEQYGEGDAYIQTLIFKLTK